MSHAHIERSQQTDCSVHGNHAPVARGGDAKVEDHGSKIVATIALIIGTAALIGMLWAMSEAHRAETAAEVATMRVEGLTRAMIAHGIKDTYPHLPAEDD